MSFSDKIATFIANQPHFSVNAVVCFMAGTVAYFALPFEPDVRLVALALTLVTGLWIGVRNRLLVRYAVCFLFFFVLGFLNANLHGLFTHTVMPHTLLERVILTGTVTDSNLLYNGQSVTLDVDTIQGLSPDKTPKQIRVTTRFKKPRLKKGQKIRAFGSLFPINRPIRSLTPDMSQIAFYDGYGMTGILYKAWIKSRPERTPFRRGITKLRRAIATRIDDVLPRETSGVAKALVIGEQRDISEHTRFLYRVSGIYHVLSVSGFHMSLIALFFFFIFRHLFSLSVWLDEKINTRKLAAVCTLLVAFFYVLLSGMQTPALRAFIMLAFVLGGIVLGRNALSVRTVALAAFLLLLAKPHLILTASFQLSFSAVLILICVYQRFADRFVGVWAARGFLFKGLAAVIGMIVASLLATLATLPTVGYHFHQVAPYGVIGNLATGFIFSFGIMPLLVGAMLLMPFGWDTPFWAGIGYLLNGVNAVCEHIALQPLTTIVIPAFYPWGLATASLGIIIICLMNGRKSFCVGLGLIAVSFLAFYNVPKPDFMVAENGKLFAMRDKDGTLLLSESYFNRFVSDKWLLMNGQNPVDYWLPASFRPDSVTINGVTVGLSNKLCRKKDIDLLLNIKTNRAVKDCVMPALNRSDFMRDGMVEFYMEDGRVRIEKPADTKANRIWRTNAQ